MPAEQTSPEAHAVPHVPQLAGSLVTSTQAVPHFVVPPVHWSAHAPAEQTSPEAPACPHGAQSAAAGNAPMVNA